MSALEARIKSLICAFSFDGHNESHWEHRTKHCLWYLFDPLITSQVPTLIVYGEKDNTPMAKQAPDNLRVMPNSQEVPLKNAGHAAYLDQPDMFHKLLYNFMELLHH